MKKFMVLLIGVIFVALITASVQFAYADHTEPGIGIFKDATNVELIETTDTEYQVYLQIQVRNGNGQLISITESTMTGAYIPHELIDRVFDTLMGQKEIVTIDNIKYEQAKWSGNPGRIVNWQYVVPIYNVSAHFIQGWFVSLCSVFDDHGYTCITPFQAITAGVFLVEDDVVENHWTILRIIN